MGVLQSGCHLLDGGYCRCQRQTRPIRVTLPCSSAEGIVHDENRCTFLKDKFEYPHNVCMPQLNQRLCFREEAFYVFLSQGSVEYLESGRAFQIHMFT